MPYRCPECKSGDGLWQEISISGWRSLNDDLTPTGERDVDWSNVEAETNIGCSCGWTGLHPDFAARLPNAITLERVGTDGEPLPEIHPDQMRIEAA